MTVPDEYIIAAIVVVLLLAFKTYQSCKVDSNLDGLAGSHS
jgi:hypothetical protein